MSEDCLVLNVLTPGLEGKRPVMVWFHGGGFESGSGSDYTGSGGLPQKEDVVLVQVNHRLNIFGYLYLKDVDPQFPDSGNVGQLDLIAALQWVRENIEDFGGDPGNVTVFGASGGGAKVSALMAMPGAAGLFHRAIAQGGCLVRAIEPDCATETTLRVLRILGLQPSEVERLCLLPQEILLDALVVLARERSPASIMGTFGPVVDGTILPRHPWSPAAPEVSRDVPLLIGCTKDEATVLLGLLKGAPDRLFNLGVSDLVPALQDSLAIDERQAGGLIDAYRRYRPSDLASQIFFAIGTDYLMRGPASLQAERKDAQGAAPAFLYLFDWVPPAVPAALGAYHGLELPFVFDTLEEETGLIGGKIGSNPDAVCLANQVRGAWAQFARTGDPNHPRLPLWPRYGRHARATMVFNTPTKVLNDPRGKERATMAEFLVSSHF